ncbi:MAG: hypothetical protein ACYSX0_13760 [Planctomycetota bacterium]
MPEFLVTEWTTPMRGRPYAAHALGEMMIGFFEAGIDVQTISCWEEFHAKPDPEGFAPWGLITQQGLRKNTWHVHRFFDRVGRTSAGVAVLRKGKRTLLVSRHEDGAIFDLLVWDTDYEPRLAAAIRSLKEAGFGTAEGREYQTLDRLERAIAAGVPHLPKWESIFRRAARLYRNEPIQTRRVVLDLPCPAEVLAAESVRMTHERKRATVIGNVLSFPLRQYEVTRLRLRIRFP